MAATQEFVKVSMIAKDEVKKLINAENNPEIGPRQSTNGACGNCRNPRYHQQRQYALSPWDGPNYYFSLHSSEGKGCKKRE